MGAMIPIPKTPVVVRTATMDDLPFIDGLQKTHNKALGYFPTQQFEGYIAAGAVLIAEEGARGEGQGASGESASSTCPSPLSPRPSPLGYVIGKDRYLKRDELGVVYQLCVVPSEHRKLIGAALVQALFERSAYGCKLFCCWCAQDLPANHFWESLGFVPIAFRAGSTGKRRVHIFWQRRINENDATPYWYPSQTNSGAIREDRLVFPIPPGTHWKDVQAIVLPKSEAPKLESTAKRPARAPKPVVKKLEWWQKPLRGPGAAAPTPPATEKPKRAPKEAAKIDPKHIAAARELRDRCLERFNSDPSALASAAKYHIGRALPEPMTIALPAAPALQTRRLAG